MATPALVAAPGMLASEVVALSDVPVRPPRPDVHHGYMQPKDPHRVIVKDERRGFEIPAGLFSLVETRHDKVQRLRATPHIDYVNVEGALDVSRGLVDAMTAAGWEGAPIEVEPARFDLAKTGFVVLGPWRAGPWVAELSIRRSVEAASEEGRAMELAEDGLLVTLHIWDEELLAEDASW